MIFDSNKREKNTSLQIIFIFVFSMFICVMSRYGRPYASERPEVARIGMFMSDGLVFRRHKEV